MRSVKLLTDVRDVSRAAGDRWYVTNGITAVGPVNLELLARGIEAGKVPLESFIRHEAWTVWRPLAEVAVVTGDARGAGHPSDSEDGLTSLGRAEPPQATPTQDEITSPGRPAFSFDPGRAGDAVYQNIPLDELFSSSDDLISPLLADEITSPSLPPLFPLDEELLAGAAHALPLSAASDDEITKPGHAFL